jgi:hypothetical protein
VHEFAGRHRRPRAEIHLLALFVAQRGLDFQQAVAQPVGAAGDLRVCTSWRDVVSAHDDLAPWFAADAASACGWPARGRETATARTCGDLDAPRRREHAQFGPVRRRLAALLKDGFERRVAVVTPCRVESRPTLAEQRSGGATQQAALRFVGDGDDTRRRRGSPAG